MKKLKKILWAYDGSEESRYALRYAVYFAKEYNAEILGLHINTITDFRFAFYSHYAFFLEQAAKEHDEEFELKFKCITNRILEEGIKFKSKIIRGYSDREIPKFLKNNSFDLAVMGVTGRSLIGRMLVGSTTLQVLEKSDVPILTVRELGEKNSVNINKILIPVDISEKFESALEYSIEIAEKFNAHVTVVYMLFIGSNLYEMPKNLIDEILDKTKDELDKRIEHAKKHYLTDKNYKLSIRPKILFGMNAGIKIADYAKKNKFDLIVMNKHAKKTLSTRILGSVTNHVIRSSNCPVLAMKP